MSETKDPAIKLFGKTIPVPEILVGTPALSSGDVVDESVDQNHDSSINSSKDEQEQEIVKDTLGDKPTDGKKEDGVPTKSSEEFSTPDAASRTGEESVTLSTEREAATLKTSKIAEEEQDETSNSHDKNLKKPDKILPCPRCSSMDTKFCYYNNYNVNQPRHFCKNCQRYWTAGGTMRNVPIGAGRRKNKNSSPHYRQITVTESTLQNSKIDFLHRSYHPNGTLLKFGSETPLCESMASVLKLADKTVQNYARNGFDKPEELRICVPHATGEKGDDQSNKSSITSTKSMEGGRTNVSQEQAMSNGQSFPPQGHYFRPGTPWLFPWNPMQWSSPVPPPSLCQPGFSLPLYPATTYWGCTVPGAWNVPWQAQPSSPNGANLNSSPTSPTLGKHSRDDNAIKLSDSSGTDGDDRKESSEEKCLWFPKTLRIDDSREAEKSSFWTTLGIKNDNTNSVPSRGLFEAFPSKCDDKNHSVQASLVLQANPAALSRSLNFQETS